jgi:glycosyltransferase involved in cell wall biosynthesis
MRILYIVNEMGRGGVEMQIHDRTAVLIRKGHSVCVVSMMPFRDLEESLRRTGASTHTLDVRTRYDVPRAMAEYRNILRSFRPEVVHAHLYAASIFARLARIRRRSAQPPRYALVCSSHTKNERHPLRYATYRATNFLGDAWASVTREGITIHEARRAVPRGTALWMPNGVDVARYRPDDNVRHAVRERDGLGSNFVWLAVGSFRDEGKDYGCMLGALREISSNSILLIAGEGELLESKRDLATSLGLGHRVRFLGLRDDIEQLMQAADGYVFSSQPGLSGPQGFAGEAMPNVLLQAGASALPVVTTGVAEAPALVQHGVTGFVVPPKDAQKLALAMERVEGMTHDERRRLGRSGREHVEAEFSLERAVARWESLYLGLVKEAP